MSCSPDELREGVVDDRRDELVERGREEHEAVRVEDLALAVRHAPLEGGCLCGGRRGEGMEMRER